MDNALKRLLYQVLEGLAFSWIYSGKGVGVHYGMENILMSSIVSNWYLSGNSVAPKTEQVLGISNVKAGGLSIQKLHKKSMDCVE